MVGTGEPADRALCERVSQRVVRGGDVGERQSRRWQQRPPADWRWGSTKGSAAAAFRAFTLLGKTPQTSLRSRHRATLRDAHRAAGTTSIGPATPATLDRPHSLACMRADEPAARPANGAPQGPVLGWLPEGKRHCPPPQAVAWEWSGLKTGCGTALRGKRAQQHPRGRSGWTRDCAIEVQVDAPRRHMARGVTLVGAMGCISVVGVSRLNEGDCVAPPRPCPACKEGRVLQGAATPV